MPTDQKIIRLKKIQTPLTLLGVLHPSAKCYQAWRPDGVLNVIAAREPFNDDKSIGIHVSVSHISDRVHQRKATDDEVAQVARKFFGGIEYEEQNKRGSLVRHLWQINEESV